MTDGSDVAATAGLVLASVVGVASGCVVDVATFLVLGLRGNGDDTAGALGAGVFGVLLAVLGGVLWALGLFLAARRTGSAALTRGAWTVVVLTALPLGGVSLAVAADGLLGA